MYRRGVLTQRRKSSGWARSSAAFANTSRTCREFIDHKTSMTTYSDSLRGFGGSAAFASTSRTCPWERESFIDNPLVRIQMIWKTGLAP